MRDAFRSRAKSGSIRVTHQCKRRPVIRVRIEMLVGGASGRGFQTPRDSRHPPLELSTRGSLVPRKSRASGHFERTKRVADASGRCVSDIPDNRKGQLHLRRPKVPRHISTLRLPPSRLAGASKDQQIKALRESRGRPLTLYPEDHLEARAAEGND
jgi:hypothetical protein